jgi:hypothetical protein
MFWFACAPQHFRFRLFIAVREHHDAFNKRTPLFGRAVGRSCGSHHQSSCLCRQFLRPPVYVGFSPHSCLEALLPPRFTTSCGSPLLPLSGASPPGVTPGQWRVRPLAEGALRLGKAGWPSVPSAVHLLRPLCRQPCGCIFFHAVQRCAAASVCIDLTRRAAAGACRLKGLQHPTKNLPQGCLWLPPPTSSQLLSVWTSFQPPLQHCYAFGDVALHVFVSCT